jgi:hypothetical protein
VEELLLSVIEYAWMSDARQIEMHTAEPLILYPSPFGFENATAKLKKYKYPRNDQILAELIQAGSEILWPKFHKFINSIWNKEVLPDQWKESIIIPVHEKGNKTVVIIVGYHCY